MWNWSKACVGVGCMCVFAVYGISDRQIQKTGIRCPWMLQTQDNSLCKRGNVLFYWHFLLKRIKIQGGATVGLQLWVHKTEFVLVLLFINYCIIFHMNNYKPTFPLPHISDFWISIIRIEFLIKCSHTVTPQKCPLNCTFILLQLKTNRKPWTRGPNTGLSSSLCRHLSCALGQVTANL